MECERSNRITPFVQPGPSTQHLQGVQFGLHGRQLGRLVYFILEHLFPTGEMNRFDFVGRRLKGRRKVCVGWGLDFKGLGLSTTGPHLV